MSKAEEMDDRVVLEAHDLGQRLDCARRAGCLDVAIRQNWRAWTCRGCNAFVAGERLRAEDAAPVGGAVDWRD